MRTKILILKQYYNKYKNVTTDNQRNTPNSYKWHTG